jgi:putative SOS response-associated peptidase YedK
MCGRFTLTWNLNELQGRFGFIAEQTSLEPKYNIAPTDPVLTVINDGQRRGEMMRWGLIPFWAKDPKIGSRMINAVGETAATKPAFRNAFKKRRCLVLANGFYEWKKGGKLRTPIYLTLKSGDPMAFAGLWEIWKSPDGEYVRSCTIVTTTPNSLIEPVHNRMPVILSEESEALWLDPLTEDPKVLEPLLIPAPPEIMGTQVVSDYVNSVRNQGPECIVPPEGSTAAGPSKNEGRLFD